MLTMRHKEAVTKELRDRYQRSSKKGKTHILNEFIQLTRYNRSYAARACFVEQKNYSVIRRAVVYSRYDTNNELNVLNELYGYLRFYVNFFQPVRKLIKKKRIGSKVIKRYDEAKTPYQRVLASSNIKDEIKMKLKSQYDMLNPAELKRKITKLQNKLLKLNTLRQEVREDLDKKEEPSSRFEYIST